MAFILRSRERPHYTCALGSHDQRSGLRWLRDAVEWLDGRDRGGSGTTAQRPSESGKGQEFHDTTLGFVIRFDGKAWRNPNSGASV
jgi:hypothetical protein